MDRTLPSLSQIFALLVACESTREYHFAARMRRENRRPRAGDAGSRLPLFSLGTGVGGDYNYAPCGVERQADLPCRADDTARRAPGIRVPVFQARVANLVADLFAGLFGSQCEGPDRAVHDSEDKPCLMSFRVY